MRRRLVRGGLIGAAVLYGAAALMTGSSAAQVPPFPSIPDFPFPSFTIPDFPSSTTPPPTMPPSTTSTTSPPPTMPPSTSPTSSPPPTMSPTSLPSAPEISDVIEEIIDRFEQARDEVLDDFGGLLQDL